MNYLNKHILSVYTDAGRVSFITDGEVGIFDEAAHWRNEFALSSGQYFRSQPHHHATSNFELREVKSTGIVLKYSNRFDGASFGKNLTSIDEGQIEISDSGKN